VFDYLIPLFIYCITQSQEREKCPANNTNKQGSGEVTLCVATAF